MTTNKIEITCKYCGCEDAPKVSAGKPPHAYRADCKHCNKFNKWLSKYDVDYFDDNYLINKYHSLAEHIANNENIAPYSVYADEKKELKRVSDIISARGIST